VVPVFSFTEQVNTCDLCGSADLATVSAEANLVECRNCRYRFVSPRPSQDEIAGSYSDTAFYDGWIQDEAGRRTMWAKRLQLLKRIGSGSRVLDIGAGIGTFLELGRDRLGWDVVGTEVSTSAISLARDRSGLELLLGRVEDLQLPAASFDLVTLWHVLEHVPSPAQTLKLCHSLLKRGGHLAIAVPNDGDERWWLVAKKAALARRHPSPERYEPLRPHGEVHLSQFSIPVLVNAVRANGFGVRLVTIDDQYANPTQRSDALVAAYRTIYRLTRLNFGQTIFVLAQKTSP
jgi:ubiquinone/menaquinone biosynthesis C-methylase UbiE